MESVKDHKGKTKSNYVAATVLSFFVAVLALFLGFILFVSDMDYLLKGEYIDVNSRIEDGASIDAGDRVGVDVTGVLMKYGQTKHTVYFIPVGKEYHYVALIGDNAIMSITVKGKKNLGIVDENMQAVSNSFITGEMPASIHLEGKVTNLSGEKLKYYKQALNALGVKSGDGLDVYHLDIDTTSTKLTAWGGVLFCVLFAIAMIILGIKNKKSAKYFYDNINASNAMVADSTMQNVDGVAFNASENIMTNINNNNMTNANPFDAANNTFDAANNTFDAANNAFDAANNTFDVTSNTFDNNNNNQ
ncbi:MAG: hypothetical protein PUG10_07390 [Lachnospiraceae bacterium]|nr:hypothetical protein [Lachnospiraceae bacterium]